MDALETAARSTSSPDQARACVSAWDRRRARVDMQTPLISTVSVGVPAVARSRHAPSPLDSKPQNSNNHPARTT
jgi:hypothetical protein